MSETTEQFYRRKERERIIKLLEEDHPCVLAECYPGDFCNCYQIALIKGENK